MSKPCCAGGVGSSITFYRAGAWHSGDCEIIKQEDANYKMSPTGLWYSSNASKCECGADKTYGPGNSLHSATMPCPLYKKY